MPGILPMKVIRVGSTAQSRIAQACDRCRSKKIRCDGVRPCCTQCANVGFECKTSDKLSRRAFPRGYTESLEDRVRALESEVRELKDLLDEKDEKIDMLSRIHSFSPPSRKVSTPLSPASTQEDKPDIRSESEDSIHVVLPSNDASNAPLGTSSTASFIESFKSRVQKTGGSYTAIKSSNFKATIRPSSPAGSLSKAGSRTPPRLLSDQYINIFFQEWAPLFPVIHRGTFLKTYEDFLADPEAAHWHTRKHDVAQLFLVFDIASQSARTTKKSHVPTYEQEWRRAMQAMPSTPSLVTLQCHVLAQIVYLLRSDHRHFLRHRASGITICHQLGLHLSQTNLALGLIEKETRKRVFWSQYVLDRFGASSYAVPLLLRESDIGTEYPTDVDDENLTAAGIEPAKHGEVTKMSNALALFSLARIMTTVLDDLHPAAGRYELPVRKVFAATEQLDKWVSSLPSHLRLVFTKDKPSTGIISDRSPLLSLAEFHIRLLINRPFMCYGPDSIASAGVLASANAAKHIAQICDLLDERNMNYTFPLNKSDLLLSAGFALLWQSIDLPTGSKLTKDNQKSLEMISKMLVEESDVLGAEFAKISHSLKLVETIKAAQNQVKIVGHDVRVYNSMAAPESKPKSSTRKHLEALAARFSASGLASKPKQDQSQRRTTAPAPLMSPSHLGQYGRNMSQLSISSARSEPAFPNLSPTSSHSSDPPQRNVNLDYFPMCNKSVYALPNNSKDQLDTATWEQLLANIDSGDFNIYNGIFGGLNSSPDGPFNVPDVDPLPLSNIPSVTHSTQTTTGTRTSAFIDTHPWSQEAWPAAAAHATLDNLYTANQIRGHTVPQSVLSYNSEGESLTSGGEDYSLCAMSNSACSAGRHSHDINSVEAISEGSYGGILMPNLGVEAVDGGGYDNF